MTHNTRHSRKIKGDENIISKGRHTGGNGMTGLITESPDTSSLRRSSRESSSSKKKITPESSSSSSKNMTSGTPPSKKNTTPSPSSIRKSERLGKRNFATPAKLERVEKQTEPIPMRRSERGKKPFSPSSSGSKDSYKHLGSSEMKRKREKKERSVKQLTTETEADSCESEKRDTEQVQVLKTRLTAQSYRALLKRPKRLKAKDHNKELSRIDKATKGSQDDRSKQVNDFRGISKDAELVQVDCSTEQILQSPVLECTVENGTLDDDIGLKMDQNDMCLKRKRDEVHTVSHASVEAAKETRDSLVDIAPSSPTGFTKIGGDKKQRVDTDSTEQETLSCPSTSKENLDRHICGTSIAEEREGLQELTGKSKNLMQQNRFNVDISSCVAEERGVSKNVSYGSKLDSSRFSEYWIPVLISDAQLELYCATLLSNSLSLCSPTKHDHVGAIRDILISIQKCCDHPYLVDKSWVELLRKDLELTEFLDADIKASAKLQLLDTMLSELKKQGSKVVIIFQSTGGGRDPLPVGDLLDDFVHQKFGPDSYERVDGNVQDTKKKSSLKNFNNICERFVLLLETRACRPSIKVSSVHAVIIFHSDWNPLNDLRALQRLTLDSQLEPIKVFRLYLSCTMEEKVLLLAKKGKILDGFMQNMKASISHLLLMWGASYLFKRLDEFHSGNILASSSSSLFEQSLKDQVVKEFLTILNGTDNDDVRSKLNVISEVKQNQGTNSSNVHLLGESLVEGMDEEHPHTFWKKLFEGKHPCWKYYSGSSQGNRKKVQYSDDVRKSSVIENDETVRKQRKVANNYVTQSSLKTGVGRKMISRDKEGTSSPADKMDWKWASVSNLGNNFSDISRDSKKLSKGLHLSLKPKLEKLSEVLQLREEVKDTAEKFLEYTAEKFLQYLMINLRVDGESETFLQAFLISLCWTAASLRKQKIGHKESLSLAVKHLHFSCKKIEVDYIDSLLQCLKGVFEFSMKDTSKHQSDAKLEVDDWSTSQVYSDKDDHFKVAQKDLSRSIKGIQKKCRKRIAKILQKIQKEEEDINKRYEEEKAVLENKKKTEGAVIRILSQGKMQTDELKELDNVYAEKFEELKRERDLGLEKLKAYDADVEKVRNQETHWVEQAKSWLPVVLSNKPSDNELGHDVECVQDADGHNADESHENAIPNFTRSSKMQNPKEPVDVITVVCEEGVESSTIKETMPSEIVACSSPFKTVAAPHRLDTEADKLDTIASVDTSVAGLKERIEAGNTSDNEENNVFLGPYSREQILGEAVLSMPDRHIQQEVAETIGSSDGGGDFLPPLHSSGEKRCDAGSLSPERRVHREVAKAGNCNDDIENSVSVNAPASEDQIPDVATTNMPEVVLLRVPEAASSRTCTENFIDPPPSEDQVDSGSVSAMPGEEVPLGVPENVNATDGLENVVLVDLSSKEQNHDGGIPSIPSAEVLLRVSGAASSSNCTENFIAHPPSEEQIESGSVSAMPGEEVPLRLPENVNTSDGLEDVYLVDPLSKEQNHDRATPSVPSAEVLLMVPESFADEIMVNGDINGDQNEAYATPSENANQNLHPCQQFLVNPPSVQNQTSVQNGPLPSNQALQDLGSEPTTLTGTRGGDDGASEIQVVLQDEPSLPRTVDAAASNQSNQLAWATEPAVTRVNEPVFGGVAQQPRSESCFGSQFTQSSTPMVDNRYEISNQAFPVQLSNSVDIRSGVVISDYNNRILQNAASMTSRSPQHMIRDPLQNEIERLRRAKAEAIRMHEETKRKMKSDHEQELEEIRRKYELKVLEEERQFMHKKQELDANENKVLMNKIVAVAFRSKWMDMKAFSGGFSGGVQQGVSCIPIHQQLAHMLSQHTGQRPVLEGSSGPPTTSVQTSATPAASLPITSPAASLPITSPAASLPITSPAASLPITSPAASLPITSPAASLPITSPAASFPITSPAASLPITSPAASLPITSPALSQRTALPTPRAPAVYSSTPRPPPQISSRVSPILNHQVGRGIRAPAPHLQPFRPSMSLASTTLPSSVFRSIPSNPIPTSLVSGTLLSSGFPGIPSNPMPASLASNTLPSSVFPSIPSNPIPTSLSLPQHPRPPPLLSSGFHNRAPVAQASGIVPSLPIPSMYSLDLVMDFDIRSGANQNSPTSFAGSRVATVPNESSLQHGTRANSAQMSEVSDLVYLSDDD